MQLTKYTIAAKKERKSMLPKQELGMLIALVLLFATISLLSPVFLSFDNIMNILRQISIVAIIAVGGFLIVLIGGMDISVGSVAALSGVVLATSSLKMGAPLAIGIIAGLGVGVLVGLINGLLITYMRLPSFIITLATMQMAKGLCFVITGGIPVSNFPAGFLILGRGYLWLIPIPVVIMAVIYVLMHQYIRRTKFGIYCYAIGGNEEAARLAGIKINRYKIILYVLGGFFAGVAGIILASRLNSGSPNVGANFMFEAFTAIILGGTNLSGGEGNLTGVFIGSIFIGVLANGMSLMNLDAYYQMIIQGFVLIIAVSTQAYINMSSGKSKK